MPNRSWDWLKQAEHDLKQAELSEHSDNHDWACIASHQAAGKAVKALHQKLGQDAWGHSVYDLLKDLSDEIPVPNDLHDKAKVLDGYYIPPRYPNSHPEGAPFEYYGTIQSDMALKYAGEILKFARSQMAQG
ncbi:MAG TPA: HEPN domain-containing protein [Bacteroidetes bacterium]|nr:HEPN domain-containing protein [Bacteroidota bacterium]